MVKFKKLMLVLTFTVSIIFVTVIGATYAYYNISGGSVNVTTGEEDTSVSIIFNNSDYIDLNTGIPISSSDIENMASSTTFTLTPDNSIINDYDISADIILSNIEIDEELKNNSFKYRLECTHSVTNNKQVFNGDFTSLKNDNYLTIASLSTTEEGNNNFYIDPNYSSQNYSCILYVWLEESGENQNNLMGKHFGANIEIYSMMKKR